MYPPWGYSHVTSGFIFVAETINLEVFALCICWFENRAKFRLVWEHLKLAGAVNESQDESIFWMGSSSFSAGVQEEHPWA